ncbi:MAG: DUF3500 domain-containing protein [Chitinophagaceae bacterium]|nr:DUF3500 domain-containing protein [Chitinophagaceae bacterium]
MQRVLFLLITLVWFTAPKAQSISDAAKNFVASLDASQKPLTLFPFDSEERFNFHYFPIDDRKGLPLDKMSESQKTLAMKMLSSCLADNTVKKINDIIQLENILKVLENRKADDHFRDPGKYHVAIFGVPGEKNIWGWRFEGHHVSFHFSAQDNSLVAGTPGFLGSNPAIVPSGAEKGKEILKDEKELALKLLKSFSAEQAKKAVILSDAPDDIVTRIDRKAMIKDPGGITYSEMTDAQRENFLALIRLYVTRYKKDFADNMLKEITDAGLDKLQFAWAGHTETGIGHPHYYRIVGPTLIIEYDNTQNNANHVHTVVRDLLHDYGGDQLLDHYKKGHHHK